MRILYVGNFNEKHDGTAYYDSNRKLANGFVRNGHQVYQFSDRDIARASTVFRSRKFGVIPANLRLVETAKNIWPDLLFIGHADPIYARTLKQIRKAVPHIKIAVYDFDPLWQEQTVQRTLKHAELADATFITTAGPELQKFALNENVVSFFPNVLDESIDSVRAFENPSPKHRLFYGMGNAKPDSERFQIGTKILDAFPNESMEILGMRGKPPLSGISYHRAIGDSRMGLNLSRGEVFPLYSSDRMSQYTGNGLMTLVHRRTGYDQIFKDDELAFYDDFDELIKLIAYYNLHDDEAREIAQKGWRRSHDIFSETLVTKYITEVTFREKLSEDYQWPTDLYSA
ncbi:MAG: glycosyltransferase [Sneathiella sp.]|uniref:glycosyltransferase n=1 Tax=Sneathiella sp. TaxID=1964365 RepID=UPI0030029CE2